METRRLVTVLTGIAVAIVVVIGAIVIATSVGGGSDNNNSSSSNGSATPQLPERVTGELRVFGPDPITLDPACASDAESATYIVEIYSGLVSFDKDLHIIPDIAEKLPDVSEDGKVYTFHLRKNVLFHDASRRVTANDFKFSMERALNPKTQSTVGEVYLDDIAGADDFINGRAQDVSGIKAVDDDTLQITIKEPRSYFLEKLTYPTADVVDRREVGDSTCFKGEDWTRSPNGTGPFKMKQWLLGQRIELDPNASYYLDPKPSLARVTFLLSGGSPLTMYQNDEIDISGVGINDIDSVRDPNNALNKELIEADSMNTFYIGFNTQKVPFDDVRIRQALNMAIDKDLLAGQILAGLVDPAKGVLPPTIPGYNKDLKGLPFDVDGAKKLLNDAGGADKLNGIKLLTPGRGASPGPVLDALVAMWQQNLGVNITVEQEEFGLFLRDLDQSNFQMFSLGWIADYPDPQNFLDIKLYSKSGNNETKYSNPQVDTLLEQARSETDQAKRQQLYQQAEQIVVQDAPWVPLYHGKDAVVVKPYVHGYFIPPFVIPSLRYVSIAR